GAEKWAAPGKRLRNDLARQPESRPKRSDRALFRHAQRQVIRIERRRCIVVDDPRRVAGNHLCEDGPDQLAVRTPPACFDGTHASGVLWGKSKSARRRRSGPHQLTILYISASTCSGKMQQQQHREQVTFMKSLTFAAVVVSLLISVSLSAQQK